MAEEPKANVETLEANPQVETPEQPAEPEVDWKAKYEEAEANRVNLQKNLSDRENRLRQLQQQGANTERIESELSSVKEALAQQMDYTDFIVKSLSQGEANPLEERRTVPTPTLDAFRNEQNERDKQRQQESETHKAAQEFIEDLTDNGLSLDDPEVQAYFSKFPDPRTAQRKISIFVNQRLQKQMADKAKAEEEAAKEKARKEAEEAGETNFPASSGGGPVGGKKTYTRAELRDYEFYKANKDDILLAQQEGRIKE